MAEGNINKEQTEQHPLFLSGEWEGFYTYYPGQSTEQHRMHFMLTFKDETVSGTGGDDIASFVWRGTYNKERMECTMSKYYASHSVYYNGQVDENGIWGFWRLKGYEGGFHIWPKGYAYNQAKQILEFEPEAMVSIQEENGGNTFVSKRNWYGSLRGMAELPLPTRLPS